jgi:serine/threonine protein kinase
LAKPQVFKSLFNEYTIVQPIGSGGSGTVYEVKDVEGQRFAIKVLDSEKTTTLKLKRFKNETIFCQHTGHPNIVKVHDGGRGPSGEPFYVMPLYDMTLGKALAAKMIPPGRVLPVFAHILDGVEVAHLKGVVHRDLKPQNILCSSDLNEIVVADFGIASFEEDELYTAVETKQSERLANFKYAAPEQRTRGKAVGPGSDMYSLGLILNEMFTGEVPEGTGIKTIASSAPEYTYLDSLVDELRRQDPGERPTISALKQELTRRSKLAFSEQKIDALSREVVPSETIDDFTVRNPVKVVGGDFKDDELIVELSHQPPAKWIDQFHHHLDGITSFAGLGPGAVRFHSEQALIRTRPQDAQAQVVHLKDWIEKANGKYAKLIATEQEVQRMQQKKRREAELERERERQEVLKNLRW